MTALSLAGHAWAQISAGVCDRTEPVRDAIVDAVADATGCDQVTDAHVAQVEMLDLFAMGVTTLKAGDFAGMSGLTTLNLAYNRLTTLPSGVFDGLTSLETLWLQDNRLLVLPGGVFEGLPALVELRLENNLGYPFGPVVHAGPSQTHYADSAVTLYGTGGDDPWGRAVSYAWAQTDASGAVVTLEGADTATATFTAPALESETLLEFTLTVTAVNPGGVAPAGTTTAGDSTRDMAHISVLAATPVSVSFYRRSYTATEGGSAANVAIRLDRIPRRTVTIPLTATPEGGADAEDSLVPENVTFQFAERVKFITVTANDDGEDDDGESVDIGFGSLPSAVTAGSPSTTTVTLVDNDLPVGTSIVDVAITSGPGSDAIYGVGDTIRATVTFEDMVTVSGTPRLVLAVGTPVAVFLGTAVRHADYESGSGSSGLVFAYTVAAGDNDPDGVSVAADSLALNNGTIVDGKGEAVVLLHQAVEPQSEHRVDTVAPYLGEAFVDGSALTIRYPEVLDESSVPAASQFQVHVEDVLRTVSSVGVDGNLVRLTLASDVLPGERVRAGYTVPDAHAIRDLAGFSADAFANRAVTNYTRPTVSIVAVDPDVYEGVDVDFTLMRNGPVTRPLNARVRIEEQGDVLDERQSYRRVKFGAGHSSAPLTLHTLNDLDYEPHTTVSAIVEGTESYVASSTAGSASVAVSDNDVPEVDVTLVGPASVDESAGQVTVRLRASTVFDEEPHGHLTVLLSSADRTAVSGPDGDFASIHESIQFRIEHFVRTEVDGDQRHVATTEQHVVVHDDTVTEEDETFALRLRRPGGVPRPGVNLPDDPLVIVILDNELPGIPANVNATAGNGEIVVSWNAAAGATGYKVQWKSGATETFETAAAHGRQHVVTGGSTTVDTIGSLVNDTEYTVRVIATNSRGDGTPSEAVRATPRAPPARVTGVTVTEHDGELAVSWSAVAGATGYKIQWRSGATETFETAVADGRQRVVTGGSTTSETIGGLANFTEYTLRVIATNAGMDGPASDEITGTPTYTPPPAPPGTTLVSNAGQSTDNTFSLGQSTLGRYAQGFTTGSHVDGYTLDSIGVSIREASASSGATFSAYIYTSTDIGGLDRQLYTLTTPPRFGRDAVHLFAAPPSSTLKADTRYLLVFAGMSANARDFRVNSTRSDSQDGVAAEGWGIDSALLIDGSPHGNGEAFKISVNGSPRTDIETITAAGLTATGLDPDTTDWNPSGAIELCWTPQGFSPDDDFDAGSYEFRFRFYGAGSAELPAGSTDGFLPWSGAPSQLPHPHYPDKAPNAMKACANDSGIGFTDIRISLVPNTHYTYQMRARRQGGTQWIVSDEASATSVDASTELRTELWPAPNETWPDTIPQSMGSFVVAVGFSSAPKYFVYYEPVEGFDIADDLELANATAALESTTYDTDFGYLVRLTPTTWGEPVTLTVKADAVAVGLKNNTTASRQWTTAATGSQRAAPAVTATDWGGDADGDGRWSGGESIEAHLIFDVPVTVVTEDGTPAVALMIGGARVSAAYARGTGTHTLVFSHRVEDGSDAVDTVLLETNSLALHGGRIAGEGEADAALAHPGAGYVAPGPRWAPALTAQFEEMPAEHDGRKGFALEVHFSEEVELDYWADVRGAMLTVTGGRVTNAKRLAKPSNRRRPSVGAGARGAHRRAKHLAKSSDRSWRVWLKASGWGDVTIALAPTMDCAADGAVCTADGRMLSNGLSVTVPGPAALDARDAEVREGPNAVLAFPVTLSRAASTTVTVDYATADGTANAGADYTAEAGTLTFAAGETSRTVEVTVLDDAHDEGSETLTLTLSNASGARIDDGEATGTINNSDHMPEAWMVRFGRTVGSQVVDGLVGRLDGGTRSHVTVGGVDLAGAGAFEEPPAPNSNLRGLLEWTTETERDEPERTMTMDELLLGSAFHLSSADDGAGGTAFTAWGHVTRSGFDAGVDDMTMDGDVTTGLIGADAEWYDTLAGLMVSRSSGRGSYRLLDGSDNGTVESTVTGVYPYANIRLSDRISAWLVAGAGSGELTLEPNNDRPMTTDLSMRMGAVGLKGRVVDGDPVGLTLNVKSDAMWVGMENERTAAMVGTDGDVTRLRLILEGKRTYAAGEDATFTPSAELGLRRDGGDAETGTGVEVGAGARYTSGALTIEGRVRALVAHEASGYEEWGASGAFTIIPNASGRGLAFRIEPSWGRTGRGTGQLWSATDAGGFDRGGEDFEAEGRLDAELGYGLVLGSGVLTPYAGLSLNDGGSRRMRLGARWRIAPQGTLTVEVTRDEAQEQHPVDAVMLRGSFRF